MNINDIILNYIANFNFDDHIRSIPIELIEEKYKYFSDEFWQTPNTNLLTLKSKYDIPNSISFSHILRQHPSDKYINLIKDCWDSDLNINSLIEKYEIPFNKLTQLVFPIPYNDKNYICPRCLDSNQFYLQKSIKYSKYTITCSKCNSYISNLVSSKEFYAFKLSINNDVSIIL